MRVATPSGSGKARTLAPFRLPRGARELIVRHYPSGAKSRSEYRRGDDVVAEVLWEEDGNPCWAWRLRDGKQHGLSVEWWDGGRVAFVEPWASGLVHGVARHYDEDGKLLLETRFVRGTGVDLWCDRINWTLSEETRTERGELRERRWWNPDERTVHTEERYAGGREHGIFRQWNDRGRLRRGFPRYYVRGERVDKRAYGRAARTDATLPVHRKRDDRPRRELPHEYVGQPVQVRNVKLAEVRKRAAKIRPGMERREVERIFPQGDGGLQAVHASRYWEKPEIIIEIPYDETGGWWSKSNRVTGKPRIYRGPRSMD